MAHYLSILLATVSAHPPDLVTNHLLSLTSTNSVDTAHPCSSQMLHSRLVWHHSLLWSKTSSSVVQAWPSRPSATIQAPHSGHLGSLWAPVHSSVIPIIRITLHTGVTLIVVEYSSRRCWQTLHLHTTRAARVGLKSTFTGGHICFSMFIFDLSLTKFPPSSPS